MQPLHTDTLTRFAPTPSGYLHVGNVLSFAITWALAKQANGKVLLRIDDIDGTRYRPEYVEDIFETLDFLGLHYDLGPKNRHEFEQTYSQHHRLPRYHELLEQLKRNGNVYACDCSRTQISTLSSKGLYLRKCAHGLIPFEHPNTAWRVRVPQPCPIEVHDALTGSQTIDLNLCMPDFVVRRKDGFPAYQIASLADDLDYEINLIVRGIDLIDSTAAQLFLAKEIGNTSFERTVLFHHPLVTDAHGEKLSKSKGDTSLHYMRSHGVKASEVWADLAKKAGITSRHVHTANDFADAFAPKQLRG